MKQPGTKRPGNKFAHEVIHRHFEPHAANKLVTTSRYFPSRLKVELIAPLAALAAETGPDGSSGLYFPCDSKGTFTGLLVDDDEPVLLAASHYEEVDLGVGERFHCLRNGLWLGGAGESRFAALYTCEIDFRGDSKLHLEIAVIPGEAGEHQTRRILAGFDEAIKDTRVYRGRVLSFERDQLYGYAGLQVHALPEVTREQVILPEHTLDLIERNILGFCARRDALAALGLPLKKGVLLYGPPGTGKTLTIRYIASALKEATTFLVTAEEVTHLRDYTSLARMIQPAIIVIEDVDLIAESKSSVYDPTSHSLLNRLLNEMDGLREDAQILFILTTNRPEALEPALAARPGRIDQAIEIPLPDEACRRRLIGLYSGKIPIAAEALDDIIRRTKGVTASFIRELIRRAAQLQIEAGHTGEVPAETFLRAIEEMTLSGGRLTAKLLGANPNAAGFIRAA
jgi:ATP-dependent 26S proteasome regulatory subunit